MASNVDSDKSIAAEEWIIPSLFAICAGWLIWHLSAFTLDWFPPDTESAFDRLSAQYRSNDVTPGMPGLFGGFADVFDYLALLGLAIIGVIGVARVRRSHLERFEWNLVDRVSIFIGRVAMIMVVVLVSVMLYEVVLRYVFERPTLWANELSLWIAGFLFLLAGLYAMQQRSHIRIFIVYDMLPKNGQRACDVLSVFLLILFAFGLIWGGYGEASEQLYRWETLGTAFDPPIPATLTPAVLIVVILVCVQAVSNLIRDWNLEPEHHTAADEIDEEEIKTLKKVLGTDNDA